MSVEEYVGVAFGIDKLYWMSAGRPDRFSATASPVPFTSETVTVYEVLFPSSIVWLDGDIVME